MALRRPGGRVVDVGAAYLTVSDPAFAGVVERWRARGLAREWTDRFDVWEGTQRAGCRPGPVRWAAPGGLRGLVEDLAEGLDVRSGVEVGSVEPGRVDDEQYDAVVLAMPDAQAARLVAHPALTRAYEPCLTVYAGWGARGWHRFDGAFVNHHDVLASVVDDGSRRGDGAAVLVAHTTPQFTARHLADPPGGLPEALAALDGLLGTGPPVWAEVHRWTHARPTGRRDDPYLLDGRLGVCGDGWGPRSRVEAAWLSGHRLGTALAGRGAHR